MKAVMRNIKPWKAPDPHLRTSRDVRWLRWCKFCLRVGLVDHLMEIPGGSHFAHGYCLARFCGLGELQRMPEAERGKITLDEMLALGINLNLEPKANRGR